MDDVCVCVFNPPWRFNSEIWRPPRVLTANPPADITPIWIVIVYTHTHTHTTTILAFGNKAPRLPWALGDKFSLSSVSALERSPHLTLQQHKHSSIHIYTLAHFCVQGLLSLHTSHNIINYTWSISFSTELQKIILLHIETADI